MCYPYATIPSHLKRRPLLYHYARNRSDDPTIGERRTSSRTSAESSGYFGRQGIEEPPIHPEQDFQLRLLTIDGVAPHLLPVLQRTRLPLYDQVRLSQIKEANVGNSRGTCATILDDYVHLRRIHLLFDGVERAISGPIHCGNLLLPERNKNDYSDGDQIKIHCLG